MFVVYRTFIHVPRWNGAKSCEECFMCFRYHIAQIVLAIYAMACINYSGNLAPELVSTAISFISVVKTGSKNQMAILAPTCQRRPPNATRALVASMEQFTREARAGVRQRQSQKKKWKKESRSSEIGVRF